MKLVLLLIYLMLCTRLLRALKPLARGGRSSSFLRMSGWSATSGEVSLDHLDVPNTAVTPYWLGKLKGIDKLSALRAISELCPDNPLGYQKAGKRVFDKDSMMQYAIDQKKKHADKIILVRIGDFYETYGIDAIMLCNHAGLNLMKNDIKAGCPWRNVQQTLDSLTGSGFSVVIYEEISEVDAGPGPSGRPASKRKSRAQSYVATPGRRTYPHALTLKRDLEEFPVDRPYVGILGTASSGYSVVEISLEEKRVTPRSRLNEEAVRTMLDAAGAVDPIYVQNIDRTKRQRLLPAAADVRVLSDYSEKDFGDMVLRMVCLNNGIDEKTLKTFRTVHEPAHGERPKHIYASTAYQIGLKPNPNIPDLIGCLLPPNHRAHSARFLREWLSSPPPKAVARHMQELCRTLYENDISLPSNSPYIIRKVLTLLDSRQCNANVFREIADCASAATAILDKAKGSGGGMGPEHTIVEHLLEVVSFRAGTLRIDADDLNERSKEMVAIIGDVVASVNMDDRTCTDSEVGEDTPSGKGDCASATLVDELLNANNAEVLREYFSACEGDFRGHVVKTHPDLANLWNDLEACAIKLIRAIADEYPDQTNAKESRVVAKNGLVYLVKSPTEEGAVQGVEYFRPYDDKKHKRLGGYTSQGVTEALDDYKSHVERAPRVVEKVLQGLCEKLDDYQMTVVLISNWALILQATSSHVIAARRKGWSLPALDDFHEESYVAGEDAGLPRPVFEVNGLSAWWMERGDSSTKLNQVSLDGLFLLTAPNMSGKSTIMRSVLAAALLANAGLFVPCDEGARIPAYDSFFLRTSSYDVPSEGKSSFALEMDDMRVVLRDSTTRSLVMIDELGRGTSSKDGSALSSAILESLDATHVNGIFATHLHEVIMLPLNTSHVQYKRMSSSVDPVTGQVVWEYTLEDGLCTDSMALETAKEFNIPEAILSRATVLQHAFDDACRGGSMSSEKEKEKEREKEREKEKEEEEGEEEGEEDTPLRRAEEDFYRAGMGGQGMGAGDRPAHSPVEPGELGGSIGEAYERQGLEELLAMTMQLQHKEEESSNLEVHIGDSGRTDEHIGTETAGGVGESNQCGTEFGTSYSLEDVVPIMRGLAGTKTGVSTFDEAFEPSNTLEGSSCVYLLLVRKSGAPDQFYVGETDAISERVQTHRKKTFKGSKIRGAVVKAPNKSTARLMESRIIGRLKKSGYFVAHDADGKHTNFGAAST